MVAVQIVNDTDSSQLEPAYWYHDYWLHRLSCDGLDGALGCYRNRVPFIENTAFGDKLRGNSFLFYWKMIYEPYDFDGPLPKVNIMGKRLFAKTEMESTTYEPVVHVCRTSSDSTDFRLYASRNFIVGDAILFIPEFEEESDECILGGGYCRIVEEPAECNSYLTSNRTLRCAKDIQEGEEITRCAEGTPRIFHLENIDRVIISLDSMSVGRIGLRYLEGDANSLIRFSGNRIEKARHFHLNVFKNHRLV